MRDIKIIEGGKGLFVAMPSRKLCDRCPSCAEHLTPDAVEIKRGAAQVSGPAGR